MLLKWNVRCIFMYYALYYFFFNSDKLEIITDKNIPIVNLFHSFIFIFFFFLEEIEDMFSDRYKIIRYKILPFSMFRWLDMG